MKLKNNSMAVGEGMKYIGSFFHERYGWLPVYEMMDDSDIKGIPVEASPEELERMVGYVPSGVGVEFNWGIK